MITLLGPTASGKTRLAALTANRLGGEIISADSRQVFREMNIGTGKDYNDYVVNGKAIPYHLIDVAEPGEEYNVYRFQKDFLRVYEEIKSRNKFPILCGGTGLYIESVLKGYRLVEAPVNKELRQSLEEKTQDELIEMLSSMKPLHATTDTSDKSRTIRAIEVETWRRRHSETDISFPVIDNLVFGISFPRDIRRKRISERLAKRLREGLVEEVKNLLEKDISPQQLKLYGLEYKYITMYLLQELDFEQMVKQLNTAIHQFAKRQMTWFRKMEKNRIVIHWLDGNLPIEDNLSALLSIADKSHNIQFVKKDLSS